MKQKTYDVVREVEWRKPVRTADCVGKHDAVSVVGKPYAAYCRVCSCVAYEKNTVVFKKGNA